MSDTSFENSALSAFCGDEKDAFVGLVHGFFDDFKEVEGVKGRPFDCVFVQFFFNIAAEQCVEVEVEVL